jgi:isoamylase
LRHGCYFEGETNDRRPPDISWHGTRLLRPGWDDHRGPRVLAFTLAGFDGDNDIHVMMNMYWDGVVFDLPKVEGRSWHRIVDIGLPSTADFVDEEDALMVHGEDILCGGRAPYRSHGFKIQIKE